MEPSDQIRTEFNRRLSPSCFKDLVMCWHFNRSTLEAAAGYSILELLVKFKEKPTVLKQVWDFFEKDEDIRNLAKTEGKFQMFLCFKKLLRYIFVGNFISDVDELKLFLCSKHYWIPCVEYYFQIAHRVGGIPIKYMFYDSNQFEFTGYVQENAPLVLICVQGQKYFPADLSEFELNLSKFPFWFHPGEDLSSYLN